MTEKKWRKKEFKRLVSLGWPRYVASRYVRGKSLSSMGYINLDDLAISYDSYYHKEKNIIVHVDIDWDNFEYGKWTEVKVEGPLCHYYD